MVSLELYQTLIIYSKKKLILLFETLRKLKIMPWNLNYRWIFLPMIEVQLYFNLNHVAGFRISRKIRWSKAFLLSLKSIASPSLLLPSCRLLSPNSWSTLTDDSTWTLKCRHVLPTKEGDLFKKLNEALSVYKSLRILFYHWFQFFTHTGSYQYKTLCGSWNIFLSHGQMKNSFHQNPKWRLCIFKA